jgi:type I restriction enzyme S subunit
MKLSEAPVKSAVKRGFKKTEVGLIPIDWKFELLDAHSKRGSGHTPNRRVSEYYNGSIVWISLADSDKLDQGLITSSEYRISASGIANSSAVLHQPGGVLMSRDAGIGKSAIAGCPFAVSQHFMTWRCNETTLHNWWLYHWLQFQKKEFERLGNGSTIKTIGLPFFRQYQVPLPPITEQRAIARALSDMDSLLGSLDALIAKKKAIKQGAMQQLLTGKQRLKGFEGEWVVKRLGEIFRITTGQSKSRFIRPDGRYFIVDMGSVSTEGKLICTKQTDYAGDFLKRGDLIMPKDDIGGGKIIGKAAFIDLNDRYVLGDHVFLLQAEQGDPLFLSFMINAWVTNSALRKKVAGSAQLSLGRKSVLEQEIPFPTPEEQTAIAEVLSDMDAEIGALEARRAKTALLKQGMMQELLTGRTRLIDTNHQHV